MGSRSPASGSQPPAFFSKLTESNSAIVKVKKQEMIKKIGNESDFSELALSHTHTHTQASILWFHTHIFREVYYFI